MDMVRTKLPLYTRIRFKLREIVALRRAKKEEKKHLPTTKDILKGQQKFEQEAQTMKKMILKKKKK